MIAWFAKANLAVCFCWQYKIVFFYFPNVKFADYSVLGIVY